MSPVTKPRRGLEEVHRKIHATTFTIGDKVIIEGIELYVMSKKLESKFL